MANKIIKYKDWIVEVDYEFTRQNYINTKSGGSDDCTCNHCRNYVAYRENIFPEEVKTLFNDLGIDYKKDAETWSVYEKDKNLLFLNGWFHFKGKLLQSGTPVNYYFSNQNFSIYFLEDNAVTFFSETSGLVQVEFKSYIPWILDEPVDD